MKKTHIYFFVSFLVLLIGCEIGDGNSPDPEDTFVKYYGDNGTQVGIELEFDQASQSMVILGSVIPSGELERNIIVHRVDLAGNEIAMNSYDFRDTDPDANSGGGGDDEPGSILVEDDGFIIVGTSSRDLGGNNPYSVIFILELNAELDSIGSMIIEQAVNDDGIAEGFDLKGMDVVRASDGTLIVTGSSNYEELGDPLRNTANSDDETQIFIAKVDLDQNEVIWRRTRGFSGDDEGIYIDEFAEDNFVIIGTSDKERGSQGRNVILMPINEVASPNDGLAESFLIDGQEDFDDVATAVFKRPTGYVVTGISSKTGAPNRPFFINFTYTSAEAVTMDQGKEIALTREASPGVFLDQEGNGYGLDLGRNGNYFVVGEYLGFGDKNSEVMVTQLDQTGAEVDDSQRNYGLVAGNDIGEDVVVLPNGDVFVLSTVDFGSGTSLLGLMRLNQEGKIAQ